MTVLTSSDVEFVSKTWHIKEGMSAPDSVFIGDELLVRFLVMKPSNLEEIQIKYHFTVL